MMTRRQHWTFVALHLLFVIFAGVLFMVAVPALVDYFVPTP